MNAILAKTHTEEVFSEYLDKTRGIVNEFRETDFAGEIISHDSNSARTMIRNSTFWIAMFMGVLPLLISFFSSGENTLYGLLFFFAVMWAGIFKGFVLGSAAPIKLPVIAFFFTGIFGIGALLTYHEFLPDFYMRMNRSSSHVTSLLGFILQTGLNEEICKLVPVGLYIAIKRKKWSVEEALLIGVFSGLGFAAFENIHYSLNFAKTNASSVYASVYRESASIRAYYNTISSMTYVMIRSLSCLFGHAVYTGIATCFVIAGVLTAKGRVVKFFLALAIPAIIHGGYNWMSTRFSLGSALFNAAAFALFYGYVLRTRTMASEQNIYDPYVEEVEGELERSPQ